MSIKPEVLTAVERMCTPLDESVLKGATAKADARCMKLIRAEIMAMDAEIDRHVKMLADCFRMAGADPDGDEDWRIALGALHAVTDLRRECDQVNLTQMVDVEAVRAVISGLRDYDDSAFNTWADKLSRAIGDKP